MFWYVCFCEYQWERFGTLFPFKMKTERTAFRTAFSTKSHCKKQYSVLLLTEKCVATLHCGARILIDEYGFRFFSVLLIFEIIALWFNVINYLFASLAVSVASQKHFGCAIWARAYKGIFSLICKLRTNWSRHVKRCLQKEMSDDARCYPVSLSSHDLVYSLNSSLF